MTFKKIISLSICICFLVLLATGVLSYFQVYSRSTATIHTVFGILFSLGVLFHLKNNFRSLKKYSKSTLLILVVLIASLFVFTTSYQTTPFKEFMDFGAHQKAGSATELNNSTYEIVKMNMSNAIQLTIDVQRAEHYWHPQMAIWIEDEQENYVETVFVSKATAKGLFFGGRSKANFKDLNTATNDASSGYRRVNALPVWSYKRGIQYANGQYVPPRNIPLADAITGATLTDNFQLLASIHKLSKFKLKVEINVAFDDNEYYSEYDFPEDVIFHNGSGQLGQPSLIFEVLVDMNDDQEYYLMKLIGHGHHSAQNGEIIDDLSTLTTAKQIIERIVIGAKKTS